MLKVEIDSHSGFCGGVIRAIDTAERYLAMQEGGLYSLGDIVHNEEELARLGAKGLSAVEPDGLDTVPAGSTVLIRAHGVAPEIYKGLKERGLEVIDCTCPVVLNIQKQIRESLGRVLIFGKQGHPEVLGLVGQKDDAVVFNSLEQLDDVLGGFSADDIVDVFSQTTMSPSEYEKACRIIMARLPEAVIHNTICRQVASRHRELTAFAALHDVIVFVTGSHSSNGKVLCDLCRSCNARTWRIGGPEDIRSEWFRPGDFVGVSGATSTPKWILEQVAAAIENLQ